MKLCGEHLVKTYSGKNAVDDVTITLETGKIYGLIGRNGAGKTTLLSMLTAQNPATAGTVTLDGEKVWENRKALSQICFSRELNISPETGIGAVKVKDYLKMASVMFPNWDQQMADSLVKEFDLPLKKKLMKLSKGMLSMVTITVAMASKAPFTILDEPVAGLDVVAREQFYKRLLEEYTNTGRTFVISTHIIEEAADVLEEVIFLHKGKVLLMENTQNLLERAYTVNGLSETVQQVTKGKECHHREVTGRGETVTVLLKDGETLPEHPDVTVQSMSLQRLFVSLCGEEGV